MFDVQNVDKLGKNFTLLDLLEQEKSKVSMAPEDRFCETHGYKRVKFYCLKDKVFACSECLLGDHIQHEYVSAKPLILGEGVGENVS
jgi:B-box zinc finger